MIILELMKVENTNTDFINLCKKLDDIHNKVVAEQRMPGANCCVGNDIYNNVYVMYDNKKPAGCLAFTDVEDGIVEIGRVYVCEEYRKLGIATKMFENAEKVAKSNGATLLILDTYERLANAVNLYKKLGFKIVPQFEKLKNSPYSICMSKQI